MGIAGIGRGRDRNRRGNAWRGLRWARGTVRGCWVSRCDLIDFLVDGLKRRSLSPPLTVPGYISLMAVTFRFFEGAFPQEKTSSARILIPSVAAVTSVRAQWCGFHVGIHRNRRGPR